MNCVKMMALSLSLLVVPTTFVSANDASYVDRAKTFVSENSKAAIGVGAALGAGAAYYLHTKNVFGFRTYVSNPAIGYAKAYVKNLKAGETKTVVATIAALLVGGYLIHDKFCKHAPVVTLDDQTLAVLKNAKNGAEVNAVIAKVKADAQAAEKALDEAVVAAQKAVTDKKAEKDAKKEDVDALEAKVLAAEKARDDAEAAKARKAAVDATEAELQAYAAGLKEASDEINKTRFEAIKAAAHEAAVAKKAIADAEAAKKDAEAKAAAAKKAAEGKK